MSESTGAMEQFNINELAGATGLILGAVSGILVVIFKSRCFCKFRVGISDKYSLCMCERKPPPDTPHSDEEVENKENKATILFLTNLRYALVVSKDNFSNLIDNVVSHFEKLEDYEKCKELIELKKEL